MGLATIAPRRNCWTSKSKQASIPRFEAMLAVPRPGAEEVLITVHEPVRLSFTATSRTTFVTHQFYILIISYC